MERDTEEWRRPWTSGGGDAPPQRVRRVVRPVPSRLARAGEQDAGERKATRTVTVRSRSDEAAAGPSWEAHGGPGQEADSPTMAGPGTADVPDGPGAPGATRRGGSWRWLAAALVIALLGGVAGAGAALVAVDRYDLFADAGAGAGAAGETGRTTEEDQVRAPVVDSVVPGEGQTTVAAVAAAVLPSVVRIDVLAEQEDPDVGSVDVPVGVGSGVIYRSDGYVVTNNHVVRDADTLEVQFSDGTIAVAEVVGTDRLTDLAVLKVERDGLPAVNLRQDRPLEVGETAIAIGSPFGLDASVTAGVVSALNRDLQVPGDGDGAFVIAALIQTDAAINPGNSGGALVDATGQLIGINTAILTGSGGSQGVGFAIPTRSAVIAADQLIERGFVSHPFLGIRGLDVTTEVAVRYREDYGIELDGGALVEAVEPGSGAEQGGIEAGDVIIELGDEPITSMIDVISAILRFDPGDVIDVVVLREGERVELEVELGERPR